MKIGIHQRYIAVLCFLFFHKARPPPPPCQEGDIRLTGGYTQTDGYAQFCVNGQWLSSCITNWQTSVSDAFCRQFLQRTQDVGEFKSTSALHSIREIW